MAKFGKWIDGINPDGRTAEAARRSLEARFAAVEHFLPLAVERWQESVEHVHDLRVSTRRAVAALRLYEQFVPGKSSKALRKKLKRIRRAAGDARDLDVLLNRLANVHQIEDGLLVETIVRRRAEAQPAIVAVFRKCHDRARLHCCIGKLLSKIHPRGRRRKQLKREQFREWAQRRIRNVAVPFLATLPADTTDYQALHRFRIRGKELRYAMELLAPAFPPEFRQELYPTVEQLQDRLGRINDHVTAAKLFSNWSKATDIESDRDQLRELASREADARGARIAEFNEWWTADCLDELRQSLLGQPVATTAATS